MKLAYCARQRYTGEQFAIHAAGCPDVERTERRKYAAEVDIVEDDSAEAYRDAEIAALNRDFGSDPDATVWDVTYFKIYPCCAAVPA